MQTFFRFPSLKPADQGWTFWGSCCVLWLCDKHEPPRPLEMSRPCNAHCQRTLWDRIWELRQSEGAREGMRKSKPNRKVVSACQVCHNRNSKKRVIERKSVCPLNWLDFLVRFTWVLAPVTCVLWIEVMPQEPERNQNWQRSCFEKMSRFLAVCNGLFGKGMKRGKPVAEGAETRAQTWPKEPNHPVHGLSIKPVKGPCSCRRSSNLSTFLYLTLPV